MSSINGLLEFTKQVLLVTFSQVFWLLGLLFIFGLILYIFARFTRITYVKSIGRIMDIIFTGWIGTPIHELGHAVFCILFGHRILEIKLYSPNSEDGTLGYVNHSYNPKSTYQRIGNFFIGVGPIIFGAVALYAALYYLVPNISEVFVGIEAQSHKLVDGVRGNYIGIFNGMWDTIKVTLTSLFIKENFSNYKFWIFLYLAICISSHMQLSPPDIKGAKGGLISILIFFIIINTIILGLEATGISAHFGNWWSYVKIESYSGVINKWLGTIGALFVFATIVSGLNFVVSYISLTIYNLVKGKGFINPAW